MHFGYNELNKQHSEYFGYMIENTNMMAIFAQHVSEQENVEIITPQKIISQHVAPSCITLSCMDDLVITSKLLINAEGKQTTMHDDLDIHVSRYHYEQSAILCTVKTQCHHDHVAVEVFTPQGPFAMLPLRDHYMNIVWTQKSHLAHSLMTLDDDNFMKFIKMQFW